MFQISLSLVIYTKCALYFVDQKSNPFTIALVVLILCTPTTLYTIYSKPKFRDGGALNFCFTQNYCMVLFQFIVYWSVNDKRAISQIKSIFTKNLFKNYKKNSLCVCVCGSKELPKNHKRELTYAYCSTFQGIYIYFF